jgi:hypothetical protein
LSSTLVFTRPVGIVIGDVTERHPGSSGVKITEIPADGAATGVPPLSSWTVISVGKPGVNVADSSRMFSSPLLVTCELALEKLGLLAVTVAAPTLAPRMVAFAEIAPSGMVTVGVITSMIPGSVLTKAIRTPPAGAGFGLMVTGRAVSCPNPTSSVSGTLIRLSVTGTFKVPSENIVSWARTIVFPGETP